MAYFVSIVGNVMYNLVLMTFVAVLYIQIYFNMGKEVLNIAVT